MFFRQPQICEITIRRRQNAKFHSSITRNSEKNVIAKFRRRQKREFKEVKKVSVYYGTLNNFRGSSTSANLINVGNVQAFAADSIL